jgi:hypothetical protein
MNPAAIKANAMWVKPGGTVIYDEGNFTEKNILKAGYLKDPIREERLENHNVIAAPISTMVKEALKDYGLDAKSVLRTKNMFALGMVYWLFERKLKHTEQFFEKNSTISLLSPRRTRLHSAPGITMPKRLKPCVLYIKWLLPKLKRGPTGIFQGTPLQHGVSWQQRRKPGCSSLLVHIPSLPPPEFSKSFRPGKILALRVSRQKMK